MMRQTSVRKLPPLLGRSRNRAHRRRLEMERLENRWVLSASVSGQVVHDVNEDGVVDPGDPGLAGVSVYLDANANGDLDIVGSYIEPDEHDPGASLNGVLPGVTLSVADQNNVVDSGKQIVSIVDSKGLATTGDRVFGYGQVDFFNPLARLRIDFAAPVSSVAIDFAGSLTFAGEVGKLEIYDAQDVLLGSVDSPELVGGNHEWATMAAARSEGDIAYAVAFTKVKEGGGGGTGRLDALRIDYEGSESWTVTDADGNYELIGLDAGSHRINELTPVGYRQTYPSGDGSHEVTVTADQVLTDVDFANRLSQPPTAVNDSRVTMEDTPVTIDVLANDLEGDNPLDPTTVNIPVNPGHGTASVDPVTGQITYTPAAGFSGFDEFRYTVRDTENLMSAEALVTIQVSNVEVPWQNQENPLDVDNDGGVYPIDVLLVINELNEPKYRDPVTGLLPSPPDPVPYYFDVDGDNYAAPGDANQIITYLNSIAVPAVPVAATPAVEPAAEAEPTTARLPGADAGAALAQTACHAGRFLAEAGGGVHVPERATVHTLLEPAPLPDQRAVIFDTASDGDPGVAASDSAAALDDGLLSLLAQDLATLG